VKITITVPECTCRTGDTAANHHEYHCETLLFWLRWRIPMEAR
jgi:hypothetical protein